MTTAPDNAALIAAKLEIPLRQVQSAVDLLVAGNTIPFIARYRKEATDKLDEIALRAIEDELERLKSLAARKSTILKSIKNQGLLREELRRQIESCMELRTLEEIYLPYKPKRRTRGSVAREQGLQPLADQLLAQQTLNRSKQSVLKPFINPDCGVLNGESALQGALDIVAETWSEVSTTREWLLKKAKDFGKVVSKVKRGKKTAEGADKFEQYFDRHESIARIPGHRVLAILRGVSEGVLRVGIELDGSRELNELKRRLVHNRQFEFFGDLLACVDDCYERLLLPATESAILADLKEQADDEAIEVFGKNLNDLLLAAPAGPRVTLGIDPGFRTGCKIALVDETGQFLANTTIYPTPPKSETKKASEELLHLIQQHQVELIAIGNGTASRETDIFVSELIKNYQLDVTKVMVSESGASIYSASELAVKEFPGLDITVRGAISIARRLQDPLAELVKTDPKSIGVGQYQHDVNQQRLKKCLNRVVQSCVNQVGVDLNMASPSLLSYISGIGPKLATNIVAHRNKNGRFTNRQQLKSVDNLGKKAFEQSAGFLRIRNGDQPLDNSAVHPESYAVVDSMARTLNTPMKSLIGNASMISRLNATDYCNDTIGLPTVEDIIAELAKPGRDPRDDFRVVKFNDSISDISDLKSNLILEGIVTNVTHFGAFIDLGVHQDALIHISQLSDQFVSDPNEVVSVGDVLKVKVLEVDVSRKRISVSRKF